MAKFCRRRLLVLTQHYRPEPNFITADVAEALVAEFDVTVVTAHPNYPEGRFYSGVRPWRPDKRIEQGVTVWRLPMYPYHGRSHLKRCFSYLSFALMAAMWAPLVVARPHVVWAYHGPFTTGLAAIWFRLLGSHVIFTCADLWPESFLAARVADPGLVMRLMFAYSRRINRVAHRLVCSTRGTMGRYAADGLPASSLCYVPVWVEGAQLDVRDPSIVTDRLPRIVYVGNLGPAQDLETLIKAAGELYRQECLVAFEVYGTGASDEELRELAIVVGAHNITFHGRVEPAKAFEVASSAAAQVVSLRSSPLFAMTIPSKLAFSMAAASPILYGLRGESAILVEESGGGIAFDTNDVTSLVHAVKRLLTLSPAARADMRARLRSYYEQHFDRRKLLKRYCEIFCEFDMGATED